MKRTSKKHIIRLLTFILTFVMLFTTVLPVFAVTITTDKEQLTGADIVSEDESKREKFSKHFLTGDGTYFAVAYSEQVNYLDDDGEWKEVDNTFSTNIFTGEKSTRNDKFKVKFANKANKDKLVSIQTDEFKVSWGLTVSEDGSTYSALNKVKGTENGKLKAKDIKTTQDAQSLGKAVSGIIYEDAYGDYLDVRYTVAHQKVKEDLILNEKSDFTSYKVTYNINNIKGAYAELDGGEVTFCNGDGEPLFRAGAPVMYDSAGEISSDIQVSIIPGKKTVEVIYTPSSEWLNDKDRVYPVTIDPSVKSSQYVSNIMDTSYYIYGSYTNFYATSDKLEMGCDYYNYIKFFNVPSVSAQYTILGTDIVLYGDYYYSAGGNEFVVRVSDVKEYWNEYRFESYEDDFVYYPDIDYFSWSGGHMPQTGYQYETQTPVSSYYENNKQMYKLTVDISSICNYRGGYTEFFTSDEYYGFELYMHWYLSFRASSSEYQNESYRPCLVTRYTDQPNTGSINCNNIYRIKNKVSGDYLTRIQTSGNMEVQPISSEYEQTYIFEYNTSGNYYNICLSSYRSEYVDFLFDYPGCTTYHVQTLYNPAPGYRENWIAVYNDDGTYSILSSSMNNFAITQYQFGVNTTWYAMITPYSPTNSYQKWELEYVDTYSGFSKTETITQTLDTFYYNVGDKVKFDIQVGFPVNELYLHNENDENVVSIDHNVITAEHPGIVEICGADDRVGYTIVVLIPDGYYYIKNEEAEKYLHVNNKNNGTSAEIINIDDLNSSAGHIWRIEHVEEEIYKITSQYSGKVLTVNAGRETSSGEKIKQQDENNTDNQQWEFEYENYGYYYNPRCIITNKATLDENVNLGMSVSSGSDGADVKNLPINSSDDYDIWEIMPATADLKEEYLYSIVVDDSENKIMAYSENTANPVVDEIDDINDIYKVNNDVLQSNQIWRFERIDDNYKIYSMITQSDDVTENRILKVVGGLPKFEDDYEGSDQDDDCLWKIYNQGNNKVCIESVGSPGSYLYESGTIVLDDEINQPFTISQVKYSSHNEATNGNDYSVTIDSEHSIYFTADSSFTEYLDIIEEAVNAWNGISDNINLVFHETRQSGINYFGTFIMEEKYLGSAFIAGQMIPNLTDTNVNEGNDWDYTWSSVNIYAYSENSIWKEGSDKEKTAVLIHEIGHALRLGHTDNIDLPSIMKSSNSQGSNFTPNITNLDKTILKEKWQN